MMQGRDRDPLLPISELETSSKTLCTGSIYHYPQSRRLDRSCRHGVSTCAGDKTGVESCVNIPSDTQQWIYGCRKFG